MALPPGLQKEIVEKAAAEHGNCQELAKHLEIPKSSVHYYRTGRLTMPQSLLDKMLDIAGDDRLRERAEDRGITKDRTWANEYAVSVYREMCRERVRLPTRQELESDDDLRRKAAAIISYVMAEGSIWLQKERWGECAVNITFAEHEVDLYEHFRGLCKDVFDYEIGPPQKPSNGARAIRGFIYSRFIAEWLIENGVLPGEKSARALHLPEWIRASEGRLTLACALQPWCDGEGTVRRAKHLHSKAFIVSQSRHTELRKSDIPDCFIGRNLTTVSRGNLERMEASGLRILTYLTRNCRSEVLDEVAFIASKLGFSPFVDLMCMTLKKDQRWSCVWGMEFSRIDALTMVYSKIIIQKMKVRMVRYPAQ